jgi:hypothetical protein
MLLQYFTLVRGIAAFAALLVRDPVRRLTCTNYDSAIAPPIHHGDYSMRLFVLFNYRCATFAIVIIRSTTVEPGNAKAEK